ncbi:MAG TPA: hypothetical protein VLT33_04440, partial [Labilithrix sp.]|nr:hypothetical protein [Labilithrix sp.]
FILRWLGFAKTRTTAEPHAKAEADAKTEAEAEADVALPRARIPFGPFLILACLELLFASEWIASRLSPLFGPL